MLYRSFSINLINMTLLRLQQTPNHFAMHSRPANQRMVWLFPCERRFTGGTRPVVNKHVLMPNPS
jgi:hypothetical protein